MSWTDSLSNATKWINLANETLSRESIRNIQDRIFKSTANSFSPSQFGIVTGIIISVLVNLKANKQFQKSISTFRNLKGFYIIKLSVICLVILPVFLAFLLLLLIIRNFVRTVLKITYGNMFRDLVSATDTIWTVEKQNWKSIINILVFLEDQGNSSEDKSSEVLQLVRNKFREISKQNESLQKIFYRLNRKFGYSFWTTSENKVEDYVRFLDIPSSTRFLSMSTIKDWLGKISNDCLPKDHSLLWEILVCKKPVLENGSTKYVIICRVHHSLGDGVALLRFFLETIADQRQCSKFLDNLNTSSDHNKKKDNQRTDLKPSIRHRIKVILKWINLATSIPFFIHQHLSVPEDKNILHGSNLSGSKICSWIYEPNSPHLLNHLRKLKRRVNNARLSDFILTALSASLYLHYKRTNKEIPQSIQIIVPARIEQPTDELRLENKFSVTIQKLPIMQPLQNNYSFKDVKERVLRVKEETDKSQPHYLMNYAIMTVFGYLLPYPILQRIFQSKQATMVFSNLPGPTEEATLGNYKISNLSFCVPHRDLTGIGLTLLTYAGKMHFTICADKALIPTTETAQDILQDLDNEIKKYVMVSSK